MNVANSNGLVKSACPVPDRRAQHGLHARGRLDGGLQQFALPGLGGAGLGRLALLGRDLLLDLAQFGARRREVDLGAHPCGPGREEPFQHIAHREPLGIEAPHVLVIEDAAHARPLVDPQHVRGREADVVILQHQASADMLGALLPPLNPACAARLVIVVHPADMRDHHRLVVELHPVQHLGLARQIPDAFPRQLGVGRVQQDILRRVEGQADVVGARLGAERAQFRITVGHHGVELRHVGMRGIGRDVRRQPVHVEPLGAQIIEHAVEQFQRAFEVRALLPAPRILRLEIGAAHHLDGKAEAQGAIGVGHAVTWAWGRPRPAMKSFQSAKGSAPPVAWAWPLP